jgi:hypothetical protein
VSESKFDWSWDQFELSKDLLQKLISMESLYFHPDSSNTSVSTTGHEPSLLQTGIASSVFEELSELPADTTSQILAKR